MALIRSLVLGLLIYGGIAVSFPDWSGQIYHVLALSMLAGGAVAVWFLGKILDLGSGFGKIALEGAFLLAVALGLGYTMPTKSRKPPIQQWLEGSRPTRDTARQGFDRLGVNPNGKAASRIVDLFPKR